MAANKKQATAEVPVNIRGSMESESRFGPFHEYAKSNPDKDFIIVNHAKGAIQRHEQLGWRIVREERLYESEFEELSGETAGQTKDGFAHLPCGLAGEGKATFAVLMYAPKGTLANIQKMREEESRQRKSAYAAKADAAGQKRSGGIESYTPEGFAPGGLQVDTVNQSQS